MKKLLLVLVVVALASFLLVGCLPGTTPAEGEGEGEGEGEVVMTFASEYTNAAGETFIKCEDDILTVTTPTPVEIDYVVYVAVKMYGDPEKGAPVEYYDCMVALTPDATRTIWTLDYTYETGSEPSFLDGCCPDFGECDPFCVVALLKHPCCPGEEIALRVVSVDCTPPELDLFVKFTDCADVCVEPDPCVPEFEGVSMEWTSRTSDPCETLDCCEDTCSGVNGWSLVIEPDPCLGPCDTVSGTGCPVEGVLECACLAYAPDTSEDVCYYVDFSFEDNVGNAVESTWKLCFDTDELVEFELGSRDDDGDYVDGSDLTAVEDWYTIYDMAGCPVF